MCKALVSGKTWRGGKSASTPHHTININSRSKCWLQSPFSQINSAGMDEWFLLLKAQPQSGDDNPIMTWRAKRTRFREGAYSDLPHPLSRYQREISAHVYPTVVNQPPNLSHHLESGWASRFQHFLESSEEMDLCWLISPWSAHALFTLELMCQCKDLEVGQLPSYQKSL